MGKVELKIFKAWLTDELKDILESIFGWQEEKWLNEEQFLEQFQMFSKDYLKHNRHKLLCRKPEGAQHWAYAMHDTNRRLREGLI